MTDDEDGPRRSVADPPGGALARVREQLAAAVYLAAMVAEAVVSTVAILAASAVVLLRTRGWRLREVVRE